MFKTKKIFSVLLCSILLAVVININLPVAQVHAITDDTSNIGLSRSSVAVSSNIAGWEATNAIDGNGGTVWSSIIQNQTGGQWIYVDLGENNIVNQVRLVPRTLNGTVYCFPQDFVFQSSTDGSNWTDVPGQSYVDIPNPADGNGQMFTFGSPVTARYIRLLATKFRVDDTGHYYIQIAEMDVYPETILPRITATSSSNIGGWEPTRAKDADGNTAWSSIQQSQTGNQWLQIDMGADKYVKKVKLVPRLLTNGMVCCFPQDFKFQYSTNGTTWTDIPGQSYVDYPNPFNGNGEEFTFGSSVNARYIRLAGTKFRVDNAGAYYMQMAEMYLYNNVNLKPNVIPSLREWTGGTGNFTVIPGTTRICVNPAYSTQLTETANTFRDDFNDMSGYNLTVVNTSSPAAGDFYLTMNSTDPGIGNEGYLLNIDNYVTINAQTVKGVFYGTRTVLQVLRQDSGYVSLPKGWTRDYPRYKVRALMLDNGRRYMPKAFIEDYIKLMSWYKMSELQLHFTEFEGWSLQCDTYPGLASANYYSKTDLREIQDMAKKYSVDIIPEVDTPSHAGPIVNIRPDLRHPTWNVFGLPLLDVTKTETYTFVNGLFDEYCPIFDSAYFHLGTDEYVWEAGDYWRNYVNYYIDYVKAKGKTPRIWSDALYADGSVVIKNDAVIDFWQWDDINPRMTPADFNNLAANGYNLINSSGDILYITPSADLYPDNLYLYEQWQPNIFSRDGVFQMTPDSPHLWGAKVHVWNDHDSGGRSLQEVDRLTQMPLKILSEVTWGGQKSSTLQEFEQRVEKIGQPPSTSTWDSDNLALYKPVTASTEYDYRYPAINVVDGDRSTRWCSVEGQGVETQWMYVDLGKAHNINRVKLNWETAYATAYQIQVSNDSGAPANWTDVYSTSSGTGGPVEIAFNAVNARYVRVYCTQRVNPVWGNSLWEFEVYEDNLGENMALGRPVAASTVYNSNLAATKAVDGNMGTRWCSVEGPGADIQWIYAELGAVQSISNVKINWETAYATIYKVQVSTDSGTPVNWIDVYSTKTGRGGAEYISFNPTNARYVRIYGTQRVNPVWGYSIWELAVYK